MIDEPGLPTQPPRRPRWRRWALRLGASAAALVLVLYLVLSLFVEPYVQTKLQRMVGAELDAELRIGALAYSFPYGVRIRDAVLVAHDEDGKPAELIRLPRAHLRLAELPWRSGPLVISDLIFDNPSVHLIQTRDGLLGRRTLLRKTPTQRVRLSRVFRLNLVRIVQGQIVYEDRTRPGLAPLVWRNIGMDFTTSPEANPVYDYVFNARAGRLGSIDATGRLNIDELDFGAERFSMNVDVAPNATETAVPPQIQELLKAYQLDGRVRIEGSARMPVRNRAAANFDATIRVINARAMLPQGPVPVQHLKADLRISTLPIDRSTPTTVSTTAPGKSLYFHLANAGIAVGQNRVIIRSAAGEVDSELGRWRLSSLNGRAILGTNADDLPPSLQSIDRAAQVIGTIEYAIRGEGELAEGSAGRRPYQLEIRAGSPALRLTDRRLLLNDVAVNALASPDGLALNGGDRGISARFYGGSVQATGQIDPRHSLHYRFALSARDVDLRQVGQDWSRGEEKPLNLSGRGMLTIQGAGEGMNAAALDALVAKGEFKVTGGEFYEIPALAQIAQLTSPRRDAATIGQAAGIFRVAHRRITFEKIAAAAPILGLQGKGTVDFDGKLDLTATAVPLEDWKKRVKDSGIPLIGHIGSELVGGLQKLINSATSGLLHLKIGGTLSKPTVTTEPVPAVSDPASRLFGSMIKGGGDLLEDIKK